MNVITIKALNNQGGINKYNSILNEDKEHMTFNQK